MGPPDACAALLCVFCYLGRVVHSSQALDVRQSPRGILRELGGETRQEKVAHAHQARGISPSMWRCPNQKEVPGLWQSLPRAQHPSPLKSFQLPTSRTCLASLSLTKHSPRGDKFVWLGVSAWKVKKQFQIKTNCRSRINGYKLAIYTCSKKFGGGFHLITAIRLQNILTN